jgi:hypothetical protein
MTVRAFGAGRPATAASANNEVPMPDLKTWDDDPLAAFTAFVTTPAFASTSRRLGEAEPEAISTTSAAVYIFMFRKFTTWLAGQNRRFSQVEERDLCASSASCAGAASKTAGSPNGICACSSAATAT